MKIRAKFNLAGKFQSTNHPNLVSEKLAHQEQNSIFPNSIKKYFFG
jgi:hypothetical protein